MAQDQTSNEVVGPFTEIKSVLGDLSWADISAFLPRDLQLDVLLLTLVIAVFIWWKRGGHGAKGADGRERKSGLLFFLLPKDIYSHVSARVDVWLWFVLCLCKPIWAVTFLVTLTPATEQTVIEMLSWIFGETPGLEANWGWMLLYSFTTLMVYDFIFFLTHYIFHKVPFFWAIHKVHHSAEVLTPLTRYREHVVAEPFWLAGSAFSYGFVAGLFAYLFDGNITEMTIMNISFFMLLFGITGSFRHYHVQMHYPKWLSRWLHSPAMHHVHHSYLEKHWDVNFAAITSVWDRLFGVLYVPEKDEYTPWGLPPEKQKHYRSFWQNMLGPFKDWRDMVKNKRSMDEAKDALDDANREGLNTLNK